MTANVVLGVQRAFRGRRLIIILLCTLVVLLVVVPLQLQHNVTNMLRGATLRRKARVGLNWW